jgi:hypothetical protein
MLVYLEGRCCCSCMVSEFMGSEELALLSSSAFETDWAAYFVACMCAGVHASVRLSCSTVKRRFSVC